MGFFKDKVEPVEHEPPKPAPAVSPPRTPPAPAYGIRQVIELMSAFPPDLQMTDTMVQVIKRTLESTKISIGSIIADATRTEGQLRSRLESLRQESAKLRQEIETRTAEVRRLQADLEETSRTKAQLGS